MADEIFQGEKRKREFFIERFQTFSSFLFFFFSYDEKFGSKKKVSADDAMESRGIRFQGIITEDVSRKLLENCDCLGQRKRYFLEINESGINHASVCCISYTFHLSFARFVYATRRYRSFSLGLIFLSH